MDTMATNALIRWITKSSAAMVFTICDTSLGFKVMHFSCLGNRSVDKWWKMQIYFHAMLPKITTALDCFKDKKVFTFCIISWILFNRRRSDLHCSNPTCCLSYTVNTIPADALATQGVGASAGGASAGMVLTAKSWTECPPYRNILLKL